MQALIDSDKEVEASETANGELKLELKGLKAEVRISAEIISLQEMELSLLSTPYDRQKSAQIIHDLKMFGLGVLTGGIGGFGAGIKVRFELEG